MYTECKAGEMKCFADKLCLPNDYICDGIKDCSDGSDERSEICGELFFLNYIFDYL